MPPQDKKSFKLYLSANEQAIGSALVQEFEGKERVVYFVSRRLLDAEMRYLAVERLCLCLYFSCTKLRPYLLAVECTVVKPKLTPYYRINHSFWSLRNNTELTCRLCRVKPGKSLITKDQKPYIKTHTKVSTEINKSQFYYINSHKGLFNCKLSLLHKSKLFRVYKYSGIKLNEKM
jgi:hypothetical protein